ncbi:predicted protein [Sclerotinia sclerotiorum 1980 UF-70]|uniref:Uncharacterized protein n=1 Tax=Sclerotinia sclerotiorum (strain ATCC 18683 / 1980 / Ss-1) TaxID=665079 RepID=A7EAW2_SCLS1|nr:predicted protein [Sclerotinia sclerotiorum 1980 UF-70]EDN99590.1 predicted protein [Sclerotinia sclerotiorum 1980 UF-70]
MMENRSLKTELGVHESYQKLIMMNPALGYPFKFLSTYVRNKSTTRRNV